MIPENGNNNHNHTARKNVGDAKNEKKAKKPAMKKKEIPSELMTRVIVRQLPPTMEEDKFIEIVSPIPTYSEFYYVNGDYSLGEFAFSRAYFKFNNFEEMLTFKEKFDNYVFVDTKGNEYNAIVEYAPLQKMPRRCSDMKQTKQDNKMNTIENDSDYIAFVEELNNSNLLSPAPYSTDALLEEIEHREAKENEPKMTPLLEFLNKKSEEKQKQKEEKRRKKEEVKKKKIEDKKVKQEIKAKEPIVHNKPKPSKPVQDKEEKKHKYIVKMCANNMATESTNRKTVGDEQKNATSGSNQPKHENKSKPTNPTTTAKTSNQEQKDHPSASNLKNVVRIRNKDRPTREIYRPGMKQQNQQPQVKIASQQQQSTTSTTTNITTTTTSTNSNGGNNDNNTKASHNSSSNANINTNSKNTNQYQKGGQQRFKHRVFMRTKPN